MGNTPRPPTVPPSPEVRHEETLQLGRRAAGEPGYVPPVPVYTARKLRGMLGRKD
ncbi:MAG TPA: hypothetical protein VFD41_11250 [Actinomycetales bacterium]|nr:hypothetical protein [Actinomycetales bacterium]